MKKIPTIFERDWNGDRSRVLDQINPAAQWVFDGEGTATQKLDGTSCMIRSGKLYKRRELKKGQIIPAVFEIADTDDETGKVTGWVPVGDGPDDARHREAFETAGAQGDGTYELLGPKVQGNPEKMANHVLMKHDSLGLHLMDMSRTFEGIRDYLRDRDIEGIVFHHPDGRMAKIKGRDFGFARP